MNNINQNIQTKLNRFNTLLTKALQQHNPTLFSLSVGTLLKLQDLMFQTNSTEASTELISETSSVDSSEQTTNQTTNQNP